ncbi:hypothetical protein J4476_02775 [Candidatus Woesearchaeota archaeon]|nr:MAG: hypothetical protein QT09_C0007G0027 [archaeon GW2011_AR18]MBS3161593.1 hypothetical protein [Candidatus Woesearchaeota archaeon]
MAKEENFDIKTEYEKISKKYKLPEFEKINDDFEIDFIEKKEFLTRAIRRRMNDKLLFFARIIENVIYPNSHSQIIAYENSVFSEERKLELVKVHKQLMIFERRSLLLDIETAEEKDIEYIRDLLLRWEEFKNELKEVAETMQESWKTNIEEKEERYFG